MKKRTKKIMRGGKRDQTKKKQTRKRKRKRKSKGRGSAEDAELLATAEAFGEEFAAPIEEQRPVRALNEITEQYKKEIKDLYLDLCEKIDTEDIQDDAREMISDNMDKFFGGLGLLEDDEGNYELDMDLLNYSQCKRLIDFLIECIVQYKVGVQVKNYFDYKQSIARLNQTINRIRKSKLN